MDKCSKYIRSPKEIETESLDSCLKKIKPASSKYIRSPKEIEIKIFDPKGILPEAIDATFRFSQVAYQEPD